MTGATVTEYGFDDIGNRTSTKAGGDSLGSSASLRSATYAANTLNQYTSRTVPNALDVLGASHATNNVTINGSAADYRRGEYFQELVGVVNNATSVWQTVSVTNSGGGSTTGSVFVAKTPELFYYDKDGNLTNDGRWVYTWDAENRLTGMTSTNTPPPGSKLKLDFVYDWQGRRIQKLVSTNNGSIYVAQYTNRFVYDGWNLMAILKPDLSLLSSFTWGLDLSGSLQGAGGVGGLLAVNDTGNGVHFCAYDGNGNLAALVKASDGTVAGNWEYGPFGEVLRQSGLMAKANPFRFSTKYQDDESDALYYGYRFYNASVGRWLSRDPIGEQGGINAYNFGSNDSLDRFDPFGFTDFHSNWIPIRKEPWYSSDAPTFLEGQITVSMIDTLPSHGILISFGVNRPNTEENKREWRRIAEPGAPTWNGWPYPNLAALFNARNQPRYGGGQRPDNDFGAVVVRRRGASMLSRPLVSGDWENKNGAGGRLAISHDAHIKERFAIWKAGGSCIKQKPAPVELWFVLGDMGGKVPRGWPTEWSGTVVLYVQIEWRESFGGNFVPMFLNPDGPPPASPMQMSWQGWMSSGAEPNYLDLGQP